MGWLFRFLIWKWVNDDSMPDGKAEKPWPAWIVFPLALGFLAGVVWLVMNAF
jgi:hypothetical protein